MKNVAICLHFQNIRCSFATNFNNMESLVEQFEMPQPSATMLDRLKFLVNASHRSQAQFSRLIDLDPSSMSRLLSGRMPITNHFVNRLVANLGVSKAWFTKGEGVPFPRAENPITAISADASLHPADATRPKGAPVYDIDATAGVSPLSRMFAEDRIIGYLDMPGVMTDCPVVHVSGDSMTPIVPDGSYISIREIRDTSIIAWGAIYLVELEDYRMVKYLRRKADDSDVVVLHSENSAYDDIEIRRSDIKKLFLVERVINMRTIA